MIALSVLIPTKNESRNLPACLDSVAWADERVVLDSYSTDNTIAIAASKGARVVQREFDNFSSHKNWALREIEFKNPWLFILDADERVTPELRDEIEQLFVNQPKHEGYYIPRLIRWCGRPLRRGGRYPDYNLRLFKLGSGFYEQRLVHEHLVLKGSAGYLENPIDHDDDKGIERYFDRHNHYSSLEAMEVLNSQSQSGDLTANLFRNGPQRRRALKLWAYRYLPARPLFVFVFMYIFKLGFLDGRAGFESAVLRAIYEYQIDLKLRELKNPCSPLAQKRRQLL